MAQRKGAKEIFHEYNTLVLIPNLLIKQNTIVDMRNETSVAGTVDHVDGFMNITLTNAVFIDQRNHQHAFDVFHVPARMIRYVHIPDSIKIKDSMEKYLKKQGSHRKSSSTQKKSAKVIRAERNQLQTLRELTVQKKQLNEQKRQPLDEEEKPGPSRLQ